MLYGPSLHICFYVNHLRMIFFAKCDKKMHVLGRGLMVIKCRYLAILLFHIKHSLGNYTSYKFLDVQLKSLYISLRSMNPQHSFDMFLHLLVTTVYSYFLHLESHPLHINLCKYFYDIFMRHRLLN